MNWLFFTHPALLSGLAAVAIPVLIHLLLKTRRKKVRFSTLLFFRQPNEQAKRRRKLRHWLLLFARMLMVALLALGFARPFLANSDLAQARQPRRLAILVLDRSASMLAADREGPRWDRAKAALRQVLSGLRRDDRAALVSCGARAETLLGPSQPDDILKLLDDVQPTQGQSQLGNGLQLAGKLVSNSGAGYTNTIYVATDLQRNSCRNLGSYPIPSEAELKVLNFGDLLAPNVAATELSLDARATAKPFVALANFSDEDSPSLKMQFLIDDKEEKGLALTLQGGSSTNIELALPRLSPGWHSAEVRLQPKDSLALDNARYQAIYVPPPIQVFVAETRPSPKLFQEEGFFIISALDPSLGTTNQSTSPFQVEKTTPEALAAKLSLRDAKAPCQVAILPALKQIPADLTKSIEAYVRAGGGLLAFLGEGVSANRYTSEFGSWFPAQLGTLESATELDWRLWEHDTQSPIFAVFHQPNSGNLALARFNRRLVLTPQPDCPVLARFQDGMPLMVGHSLGKGRILLVNTSADTAWNDWPKHRTFVPWLHSVVRYLGSRAETALRVEEALLAGTEIDVNLGADFKKAALTLRRPEGRELPGTADEIGTWRDLSLSAAGIYSVRGMDGQEVRRLAANVPVSESDLVAMTPVEFVQQVARLETPPNQSLAASLFGQTPDHRELWRLCLLTAFALLFLELLLANRTMA